MKEKNDIDLVYKLIKKGNDSINLLRKHSRLGLDRIFTAVNDLVFLKKIKVIDDRIIVDFYE